jgi:hypothetical protein
MDDATRRALESYARCEMTALPASRLLKNPNPRPAHTIFSAVLS